MTPVDPHFRELIVRESAAVDQVTARAVYATTGHEVFGAIPPEQRLRGFVAGIVDDHAHFDTVIEAATYDALRAQARGELTREAAEDVAPRLATLGEAAQAKHVTMERETDTPGVVERVRVERVVSESGPATAIERELVRRSMMHTAYAEAAHRVVWDSKVLGEYRSPKGEAKRARAKRAAEHARGGK